MARQSAVKIPEFKDVPESFSGFSKLLEVKNEDYHSGIILPSLEEVEIALRIFNGERSHDSAAMATQNQLEKDTLRHSGPVGFMILKQAEPKISESQEGIVDRTMKEAKKRLSGKFGYHDAFDYDAMGSNFFKTSVSIESVGDKFILGLNAAYVGKKPEDELAKAINYPQVLRRSEAILKMDIVDGWWFNVNLEEILKDTGMEKQTILDLASLADSGARCMGNEIKPMFEYKGKTFRMGININCHTYAEVRHGKKTEQKKFLTTEGTRIIGPAWKVFTSDGEPKPVDIELGLFHSGEGNPETLIDRQYFLAMIEARNYIAEKITKS